MSPNDETNDDPLLIYAARPRIRCALARKHPPDLYENPPSQSDLRASPQIETQPQGKCSTRRAAGLATVTEQLIQNQLFDQGVREPPLKGLPPVLSWRRWEHSHG